MSNSRSGFALSPKSASGRRPVGVPGGYDGRDGLRSGPKTIRHRSIRPTAFADFAAAARQIANEFAPTGSRVAWGIQILARLAEAIRVATQLASGRRPVGAYEHREAAMGCEAAPKRSAIAPSDTPHSPALLPLRGRSRDKPRSHAFGRSVSVTPTRNEACPRGLILAVGRGSPACRRWAAQRP